VAAVKKRSYRSPLRERQAAESRGAVLSAARELFLAQGYGSTTVEQVARRAGVSKSAVFAAVGNKQTLLKTVRDVALAGDEDPVPVRDRPSAQRARAATGIRATLDEIAVHIAAVHERSAPVDEVLRGAAATGEPELRDLWTAALEQRRTGAGLMVDLLASKGRLRPGLGRAAAVDILSLFMAPDTHTWLVTRCGWSTDDYAHWLRASLATQLLPDEGV
jgi:AcrR family transcriptional regulator